MSKSDRTPRRYKWAWGAKTHKTMEHTACGATGTAETEKKETVNDQNDQVLRFGQEIGEIAYQIITDVQ